MNQTRQYSPEVQERAVRLVFAHQGEHSSQWAAICSIAERIGCSAETLRNWVRRAERDAGRTPGLTTEERERLEDLEREVRAAAAERDPEEGVGVLRPGGARPPTEVMVAFIDDHRGEWPRGVTVASSYPRRRPNGSLLHLPPGLT